MSTVGQAVILAAGRGQRLRPLTQARSKAMMPIAGKPMVERVLDTLTANGVSDFVLVVGPDDPSIVDHFARHPYYRSRIRWAEQAERKGMAHALLQARPHLHGDFILSACDNLVPEAHIAGLLHQFEAYTEARAVLSLMRISREQAAAGGSVALRGNRVTRIIEKPQPHEVLSDIASLPLYVFDTRVLDFLPRVPLSPRGEYELQDAIQLMIDEGDAVTGVLTDQRLTVTNTQDLLAINLRYLAAQADRLVHSPIDAATRLIDPILIEADAQIGAECELGPTVFVERGASIGRGAQLREAVVLRGAVVPAGARVVRQIVG